MNKLLSTFKNNRFEIIRILFAACIAIAISAVIIFATSKTPLVAISALLYGPLTKSRYISQIFVMMIPLTFTGLALCITYQSKYFSFIADSCFYMGAVIATYIAIKFSMPGVLHPIVAFVFAGIIGGFIGILPALIKIKWKAHELVTSLMFNYVFCFLGVFIVNYFLRDPNVNQFSSLQFRPSFALPKLTQRTELHAGIFIAILFVFLCYIYIYKTRWGNELRTVGDNKTFAEYIGINTIKVILVSQFIAGAIAGIGGAVEMAGMYTSFSWDVDPSYVWDGVVIALLSKNNPKYVPIAAFALSYLRIGADIMSRRSDISSEIISIIQGIIILLIAAERFLAYWKQKEENKMAKERYLAKSMEV